MRGTMKRLAPIVPTIALAACNAGSRGVPWTISQPTAQQAIPQWQAQHLARRACPEAAPGEVQCQALILNKSAQRQRAGMGSPRYRGGL